MKKVLGAAGRFIKSEIVLCAAIVAAAISMIFVPPDAEYLQYIDYDTIALLFALMAVMKGFQGGGLFGFLAKLLLRRAKTLRSLAAVLIYLPFFLSMAVTNDVSLITFVPFALVVLRSAGLERYCIPVVVMQTLAANLGSMLTPTGNPQNLYLYNASGMGFFDLVLIMLPYVALSAVGLFIAIMFLKPLPAGQFEAEGKIEGPFRIVWPATAFAVCLLSIFDVVPPLITAAIVLVFLLIADRQTLKRVDYSLLGTFAALFIFIGNIGRIDVFRQFLSSAIEGREVLISAACSQIISNVPAALLLSGFSENWSALIIGCNLGGLGTLIASMASLISYKSLAHEYPALRGKYLLQFTVYNVIFLAALIGLYYLLRLLI